MSRLLSPRSGALIVAALSVLGLTYSAGAQTAPDPTTRAQPMAWTTKATLVETTTAWLNGVINPQGVPTFYRFQYGLTKAYGRTATGSRGPIGKSKRYSVGAPLFGLRPGTTYHFRVVAFGKGGKTYGGDRAFTTLEARAARPRTVIACFHEEISRFTARAHPGRCNLWGYRGKQFAGVPIKGMRWGHWGFNPTRAAYGTDLLDGSGVRVIAYRPVACDEGRTWYSRAVIVFPGQGTFFGLRLLTCDGPSVVG